MNTFCRFRKVWCKDFAAKSLALAYFNKKQQKETKQRIQLLRVGIHDGKTKRETHAPDPSATVTSDGHYVSTGDLLSVRLYQFFGALCVVCVRGLSIYLTITEYRVVTEYKLAHFQTTAVSIVDSSLATASFSVTCPNMPKHSTFD